MKAPHEVRRGYVAVRELLSLAFAMLLEGRAGPTTFDTGGEPLEIGDIAETVASEFGGCPIERAPHGRDRPDIYQGNNQAYQTLLKRYRIGPVPFGQQVAETAQFLADKGPDHA